MTSGMLAAYNSDVRSLPFPNPHAHPSAITQGGARRIPQVRYLLLMSACLARHPFPRPTLPRPTHHSASCPPLPPRRDREEHEECLKMHALMESHNLHGCMRWLVAQKDRVRNGELYRCVEGPPTSAGGEGGGGTELCRCACGAVV